MSVGPTPPVGSPVQGLLVTGQAVPATAAPTPLAQAPDPIATLLARAVDAARADAAIRQSGMGALMADMQPALSSAALPANVRAAIRQVLAMALPTDTAPSVAMLKAAIARSGLFMESHIAQTPGAAPNDMKAALLVLQQALMAGGAILTSRPPRASTAPPSKGGVVAAQGPRAAATLADDIPERLLQILGDDTEHALARQTLHQIASLPDETSGARWMFELPMMTPQGASVAQFAIERDDPGAGSSAGPAWRARFAIDLPPLGPVHVHLRLHDGHSSTALWVEQPDSLALLREESPRLAGALGGDVVVHAGSPHAPQAPPPGALVNRSS